MIRQMSTGWEKRELTPLPAMVADVASPVVDLGGTWIYKRTVLEESIGADKSGWRPVDLPCDIANAVDAVSDGTRAVKTGVLVSEGVTGLDTWIDADEDGGSVFVFARSVTIPADFAGKRIFLRFDGVNYFSTVYVGAAKVAEHAGGFTSWNCEITGQVTPGSEAEITVGVKDAPGRLNPDNKGGILRPVKLFAVCGEGRIASLHTATTFDEDYRDAVLRLELETLCEVEASLALRLTAPGGADVPLENGNIALGPGRARQTIDNPVSCPAQWDAEHPRLYTLSAELCAGGRVLHCIERKVGFRQIQVDGQRVLVNGKPVKLRGVCRQDMSPHKGRAVGIEEIRADLELFKDANINYVRTTNYPPCEEFLELCDEFGMYVQEEAPVAYVGQRITACNNDPSFADEFMGQFMEMLERDKSHPCVIIWGLGNESNWGLNFRLMKDYARREDPTRPLSFSYAMTCHDERDKPDIWSCHYVSHDMDLSVKYDHMIIGHTNGRDEPPGYEVGYARGNDRPVLHDEMAHIPCYDRDALMRDPASREFWGESIRRFWDKLWNTEGALGGAVWSAVDDVSCYSGGDKLNEWGILDVWRRPKPEYWHVKKAFSPVYIAETHISPPKDGKVVLHIRNRYNHTDLREVTIRYRLGGVEGTLEPLSLPPGEEGLLALPALPLSAGKPLELEFTGPDGRLVEQCLMEVDAPEAALPGFCGRAPQLAETENSFQVAGDHFSVEFSKRTGLVSKAEYGGETVLCGGPYMNMVGFQMPEWQLLEMDACVESEAHIRLRGLYPKIAEVRFDIAIDAEGMMTTSYTIEKKLALMPRTVKIRVGMDPGGLDELGVYYLIPGSVDRFSWRRRALWNTYPADHIGRPQGTALRSYGAPGAAFNTRPQGPWAHDETSPVLFGKYDPGLRGSNDFRGMKHHIEYVRVPVGELAGVEVLSDGSHSVRLELAPHPEDLVDDRDARVRYKGTWYAVDDPSGSLNSTEMYSQEPGATAELAFEGAGATWYGSHDIIGGLARVYVDGKLMDDMVNHIVEEVEKPGTSRGYERRHRRLQYAVQGLAPGRHVLTIEVTGEKEPQADYAMVMVDYFRVLGTGREGCVKLIVNNDFNSTRLAWGNYMRPAVRYDEGYQNQVTIRLAGGPYCGKEG